jgi:CheY-like chemotaxis protein
VSRFCCKAWQSTLEYLIITLEKPFLILSDINMPFMDGLELKQQIDQNSFLKSLNIPFIFITTSSNDDSVKSAFRLSIQGYFVKPNTYDEYKVLLKLVTGYRGNSVEPI